jgi:hypothetical protein
MNNGSRNNLISGICRSYGALRIGSTKATNMALLTELGYGINDIRLFYENDVRFLKQF